MIDKAINSNAVARESRSERVRATFHVPAQLLSEARGAVVTLAGPQLHLTLTRLFTAALRRYLIDLRRTQNAGYGVPCVPTLPSGRPPTK